MSEEATAIHIEPIANPARDVGRYWRALDRTLERWGDRLNPILVKESRQALKSKQFLVTFLALLFLGWGWSIVGALWLEISPFASNLGGKMFIGYFVILALPMTVIVPFGAFRSLAMEQETRTFELLSITSLGARQIVVGKLGSAVVQMSIYLSAIAPCLGFTYLLRGIDLISIFFLVCALSLVSLGLSALGLAMATNMRQKQFQVVPMVGSMLGFFFCFYMCIAGVNVFFFHGGPSEIGTWQFWTISGAILTAFVGYFLLVVEATAGRLSFASDNRSTRLRAIMVLHQMLFTGWVIVPWMLEKQSQPGFEIAFMVLAGIQWYFLGAFMIAEPAQLSSRVKRQLPQSFLGRVFLTWFYPGPGKGFILMLNGLLCTFLTVIIGAIVSDLMGWAVVWPGAVKHWEIVIPFGIVGMSYVVIYLGLGLLILRGLGRFVAISMILSYLVQIMLLLLGCVVPFVIEWSVPSLRSGDYSLLHIANPFWTLAELMRRFSSTFQIGEYAIVPIMAVIVLLLNLPGLIREVRSVRIIKPQRVLEEDGEPEDFACG